jgi:flavin-dependent dehydrogenase
MANPEATTQCDVTIIGGGLAGKAASLHLARAGLNVVCIEAAETIRAAVGESLDWSAPDLLKSLGLSMEFLVEKQIATWKRHVTLQLRDGSSEQYVPSKWLGGVPFHMELRTLHVDRVRLDEELSKLAIAQGIRLVREKAVGVERQGDRICSILTSSGSKFSSKWFIDASGFATSFLGREFKLRTIEYGPAKVALWNYFATPQVVEGTTLYMDAKPLEYLEWIWEIPVNPGTVSVGYVATGAAMKIKREQGLSIGEIFREQLRKFPHFEPALRAGALSAMNVTSFRCRTHFGVAGPNWLIAGEAASMVDPITANGVTAALRHAAEASAMILKFRERGTLPRRARICYSSRILQLSNFFNGGIEKVVYEPLVRNRIGLRRAGTVYTSPAWSLNAVYARMKPNGMFSTLFFNSLLRVFRCCTWIFYQLCRLMTVPGAAIAEGTGIQD